MELYQQILDKLGISRLNKMQQDTCHAIAGNNGDVVVVSPTGTGKTLAYMLPLAGLIDKASDALQAVVIVPNRELAKQSEEVLASMGVAIRSLCCYGGRPAMEEHRLMKQVNPQVVFGTPGRLNDHFDKGNLSPHAVRYAVIDEFDKCLEMGFRNEMARLLGRLLGVRRRFLLSATDADQIPDFVNIGRTVRVDYSAVSLSSRLSVKSLRSNDKYKLQSLGDLLCVLGEQSSMVFLNYRDGVERVASYLRGRGFQISAFHGGMEQAEREAALYMFANGSANILVSTDLASRGLDIPDVGNIIHYHLPLTKESYVHRVGRTARWQASGSVYFVLGPDEQVPDFVGDAVTPCSLPNTIPMPSMPLMATLYIGKGKKDKISKGDIVGFLCKVGGLSNGDIGRIDVKERYSYVAVSRGKVGKVLANANGEKIKGIKTVVETIR